MPKIELESAVITQWGLQATVDFYQAMSARQLDHDGIVAVMADLMDPILNLVVNADLPRDKMKESVTAVFQFYQQHQATWFWQVGALSKPPTLPAYLLERGLSLIESYPAMYFNLTNPLIKRAVNDLQIREMAVHDALHDWVKPVRESFESSDHAEGYRHLNASLPHGAGTPFHHYVGYYQEFPACAGTLFVTDQAVMIHNIATRPNLRQRGFGTAMTLHLMRVAQQLEKAHCFLDASSLGFNIYTKMGFQIYSYNQLYGIK